MTLRRSEVQAAPAGAADEAILDSSPALLPERLSLSGQFVIVEPLDSSRHGDALFAGTYGPERQELWRYLPEGPYPNREAFDAGLTVHQRTLDPLFFAIVDRASRAAAGTAAYLRIDPPNRSIEVGHILYTASLQRTRGATEAMYLMARYVFEDLGYRRYEWKCDALNEPSRRAALRLGFSFEGIFRQHRIVKGRNRDTAWFSMLDREWPSRREAFEQWLAHSNFDAQGQQRRSLQEFQRASALA